MTKTEIGQAIRTRRKALRIYQSELAQRAGVTTATVIEVEKGRNFTANTLIAILEVLNMSIEIKENNPKPGNWLTTCKSCGSFIFTMDGKQCASCGAPK